MARRRLRRPGRGPCRNPPAPSSSRSPAASATPTRTARRASTARCWRPLGVRRLATSTAWTEGRTEFEGVLARDLLDAVGAEGSGVLATALNDYSVAIPLDELRRYPVLLALKMNGQYLKIMDKGPVWIVYPRDQYRELQDSLTDKRWVWQLRELHVA